MNEKIKASLLVAKYGKTLIGKKVITSPMGEWSGGICEIIEIEPDKNTPEIVLQVKRLNDGKEIGIFNFELISLIIKDNMEIECLNCGKVYEIEDYDNCPECGDDNEALIDSLDNEDE